MNRRLLRHLPLVLLLVIATVYRGRQVVGWTGDIARGEPARDIFLRRCEKIVPEDGLIYLDTDTGPPGDLYVSTLLYPREIVACDLDDIPAEALLRENTWVVVYPEPFDESRAVVKRARDLR